MSRPGDPPRRIHKHSTVESNRCGEKEGRKASSGGRPVHEDVAVVGDRLAAEEARVEEVAVRHPARSRSRPAAAHRAQEVVLDAGAGEARPRVHRRAAADGGRAVPTDPAPAPLARSG